MPVAWELGPHLLADLRGLVQAAEESQRQYLITKHGEAGVVSETIAEQLFSAGFAVSLGLLQTF